LKVESSGEYWVQISDGCGIISDTILIGKGYLDPVDLGTDTTLCEGQFLVLDAGNTYDTYLWSNGAFTSSIIVNESGIYWVTVTGSGCTSTDSVTANFTVCTGGNIPETNPFSAFYDERSNSINLSGGTISSDLPCRFILYDAVGSVVADQVIRLQEPVTDIHLSQQLAPAFYLASLQTGNSFLSLPLIVVH
jgi:hypothetical protein